MWTVSILPFNIPNNKETYICQRNYIFVPREREKTACGNNQSGFRASRLKVYKNLAIGNAHATAWQL